jgi:4-hydroxybenzoate polyprenyltransferase
MALARFLKHLRLQFQLILAPVFLLGYKLTGAALDLPFLWLFLLVHIGLYGGTTAFNSYYDRDEGPIGGMKFPPLAGSLERNGGLVLQLVAVAAMVFWGWRMALAGLAIFAMGVAYSHPRWRWKARPLASLLTVTVGQGLLPFFMGVEAAAATSGQVETTEMLLAASATALIITGLYPLTQVYQIEEDRGRGDCTTAVYCGPDKVFLLARSLVGVGLAAMIFFALIVEVFHSFWLWVLPLGYLAFWGVVRMWSRRFAKQTVYQNHDWAFGTSLGTSGAFWLFLAIEFVYPV